MNRNKERVFQVYAKFIGAMCLLIWSVATYQGIYIYGGLTPSFYVVPTVVAIIIGSLLGHASVLGARLKYKSEQFRAIADLALEFTYYRTVNGVYEYVSPSCEEITGYPPEAFYNEPNMMDTLIHPEDAEQWMGHLHKINDGGMPETLDIRIVSKHGDILWISHLCAPVYDKRGVQVGVRSTNLDITERKLFEEQVKQMAFFDPLTNLPNRRSLRREIERNIEACGEDGSFALFFLDLSRFKNINDSFGHSFGDRLLVKVAERLNGFRDWIYVSRFGGDEFVLLVPGVSDEEEARLNAKVIIAALEVPVEIDGIKLHLTGSIGIAFYPRDGDHPDALISNSDAAMYKMKDAVLGDAEIYTGTMGDQASQFFSTENMIHQGIERDEFVAYYQPKVNTATGAIVGLEALIRWQHPQEGLISPARFISVAEETGQITRLGRGVLEQALADLQRWQRQGIAVPIAINFSARQFMSQAYCEQCIDMLQKADIDPAMIELEITEQVFLGDVERASDRLETFRAAGVTIALDDFGTGYSSFNYLRQLPIDTLKIDRSFIRDIDTDDRSRAILKGMLGLSRDLELQAVAEGVETQEQRRILREMGCQVSQGFLFYRPMPGDELAALLTGQAGNTLTVL